MRTNHEQSRRVLAAGYYGMMNFGDELFREVVRQRHAEWWPNASCSDSAPRHASAISGLFASHSLFGSVLRASASTYRTSCADTIAYCGGSTFSRLSGTQRLHAALIQKQGRKGVALGISVGPFQSAVDEEEVKNLLQSFSTLVVRDSQSLKVANRLGVDASLGGDLAALYEMPSRQVSERSSTYVGLAPCSTSGESTRHYIERVVPALSRIARRAAGPVEVDVFALSAHPTVGDVGLATSVVKELNRVGITAYVRSFGDLGVTGVIDRIARLDVLLSTRLHGWIVAYLCGTPFVVDEYHQKTIDAANDLGVPDELRISASANADDVVAALHYALAGMVPTFSSKDYVERANSVYMGALQG